MPKTSTKSAEIITMLNKQVANLNVLYVKNSPLPLVCSRKLFL